MVENRSYFITGCVVMVMCYQLLCVLYGTLVRLNVSYSDVRIVIKYVRNVLMQFFVSGSW